MCFDTIHIITDHHYNDTLCHQAITKAGLTLGCQRHKIRVLTGPNIHGTTGYSHHHCVPLHNRYITY